MNPANGRCSRPYTTGNGKIVNAHVRRAESDAMMIRVWGTHERVSVKRQEGNPISIAVDLEALRISDDPLQAEVVRMKEEMSKLRADFRLAQRLDAGEVQTGDQWLEELAKTLDKAKNQDEALRVLAEAMRREDKLASFTRDNYKRLLKIQKELNESTDT